LSKQGDPSPVHHDFSSEEFVGQIEPFSDPTERLALRARPESECPNYRKIIA
jgi:hypothetical protein